MSCIFASCFLSRKQSKQVTRAKLDSRLTPFTTTAHAEPLSAFCSPQHGAQRLRVTHALHQAEIPPARLSPFKTDWKIPTRPFKAREQKRRGQRQEGPQHPHRAALAPETERPPDRGCASHPAPFQAPLSASPPSCTAPKLRGRSPSLLRVAPDCIIFVFLCLWDQDSSHLADSRVVTGVMRRGAGGCPKRRRRAGWQSSSNTRVGWDGGSVRWGRRPMGTALALSWAALGGFQEF